MTRLAAVPRQAWLLAVVAIVFFAVGVPRWFVDDGGSAASSPDALFTRVCRDHGGRPTIRRTPGALPPVQRHCVVRYGGTAYVMDAVTPFGWDHDGARLQREGCEDAARQQATAPHRSRITFVYHSDTGVCERRR
jgi:hypothetical protein